ncbi:MAG: hypothetical protein QOG00_1519 [Pyrinomonadaceae bacterium]|nr:hypothetical protein [Pyrinomonadaceae bacterium]MDQ1611588.1 hypothetical protein [Pyrinomonadaceae bacterium]MDX6269821.1 hypothetical protein [Acidobacteriota bacterium]
MGKTAKSLMACALLLYAAAYVSCYVVARPRDPAPGEVWASGHTGTGWFDLGIVLLIAAGGVTFAAIRFVRDKAD